MAFQIQTFQFTVDSSGSADPITLPGYIPDGCHEVIITPPAGHAWTLFGAPSSTGIPKAVDEPYTFRRNSARGSFRAGEILGYAALDTGTGTFSGVVQ